MKQKRFLENNKSYWIQLSKEILNEDKIEEIVALFLGKDKRVAQRAAAIIMTLADIESQLFALYIHRLVMHLH